MRKAPSSPPDEAIVVSSRGCAALSDHHRLQARVAGGPEPAGSGLRLERAEPEVGQRHHVCLDGRRLAVPGSGFGPVFAADRGLSCAGATGSMQASLDRSLVLDALESALVHRRPETGLIHHSDR